MRRSVRLRECEAEFEEEFEGFDKYEMMCVAVTEMEFKGVR